MKLVPGGQASTGEEPHSLNPREEPGQGRGPVSSVGVIVDRIDN